MVQQEVPGPRPSTETARQPPVDKMPLWEAWGPRGTLAERKTKAPLAGLLAVVCSRGRSESSPFPLGTWPQAHLSVSSSSPICQGA